MEDKQKIEEIKKVLSRYKKYDVYSRHYYMESIKEINKIVNEK